MASPQCENGYTRIANEIMEALARHRLSGQERQVLDVVLRKTYGFGKTSDCISMSQFSELTGIRRPKIAALLKGLLSKNVLGVTQKGNRGVPQKGNTINCYTFQKDYEKWAVLPKREGVPQKGNRVFPKRGTEVFPKRVTGVFPKRVTTKENITKEIKKIRQKKGACGFTEFWQIYPKKKAKAAALRAWEKLNPENGLVARIVASVELFKKTDDWNRENMRFIPHPATFLNGRRWEDEISDNDIPIWERED